MPLSLTIERKALLPTLATAVQAVESRVTIPILNHVLLTAVDDTLSITGTNLDQETSCKAPADIGEPGSITLEAHRLHDIVRKLPTDAIIAIKGLENGQASVSAGRSKFKMPTYPISDFPTFTVGDFWHRFELAGSILASMLGRLQFAMGTEETRYYLMGVYTHVVAVDGEPTLRMVATCGHFLGRLDTQRATGLDLSMPGVIIPRKAVEIFKRLAADADAAPVTVELSQTKIRLSAGDKAVASKLIDGTYPNYEAVIPKDFRRTATAPTAALIEALGRVATLSGEKVRGVKLAFGPESVEISLRNADEGSEAQDSLDIELDGPPLEIGFNSKYLAEILGQTGGDTVKIRLGQDSTHPAVISDKVAEGLFVLMPLRI